IPATTVQEIAIVPHAVILRTNRFSSFETRVWKRSSTSCRYSRSRSAEFFRCPYCWRINANRFVSMRITVSSTLSRSSRLSYTSYACAALMRIVCRSCRSSKRSCRTISAATGSLGHHPAFEIRDTARTAADEVLLTAQHHRPHRRDEVEGVGGTDLSVVDLVTDDVQIVVDGVLGHRRVGRSEDCPQHARGE